MILTAVFDWLNTPILEPSREFCWAFQFNLPQHRRRGMVLREPCSAGVPPAGWPGVPPGAGTGGGTPPAPAAGDGRATPAQSWKIFSAGCHNHAAPSGTSGFLCRT